MLWWLFWGKKVNKMGEIDILWNSSQKHFGFRPVGWFFEGLDYRNWRPEALLAQTMKVDIFFTIQKAYVINQLYLFHIFWSVNQKKSRILRRSIIYSCLAAIVICHDRRTVIYVDAFFYHPQMWTLYKW